MRSFITLVVLAAGAHASLYQRGGGSDTCGYVSCSVEFPNPYSGKSTNFGNLDQCTCLSQVSNIVKSNSVLASACSVFGDSKVSDWLNNEVRNGGSTCNYPDHCTPACSQGNPCDFQCTDGYTRSGDNCVCPHPYTECGGKCGSFAHCPSKTPQRRDANEWKKHARCDNGYTACGVLWNSKLNKDAYECIETQSDLESCGGCSIPLHRGSPRGTDCTSLPGVADVSCMNGSCYVHRCMPGYQLSVDNSMCMDEETVNKFSKIAEYGWEWFVPFKY